MTNELSFDHNPKVLESRHSGTTEVALMWSKRTDVFNHRYPYAAARQVPVRAGAP